MSQTIAAKVVAMSVLFAGYGGTQWEVIAAGLDPQARNFYHKHDNSWRGTRFSDGSAVVPTGDARLPVEYLGSFARSK